MGRDPDGKVFDPKLVRTKTPPGSSWHNYGLAIDSCFDGDDPYFEKLEERNEKEYNRRWMIFGRACSDEGLEWGGNFPSIRDMNHAQIRFGFQMKQVQALYKEGGIEAVWAKMILP